MFDLALCCNAMDSRPLFIMKKKAYIDAASMRDYTRGKLQAAATPPRQPALHARLRARREK